MASARKRKRRTFTVEEVADWCIQDFDNAESDIDSNPGGILSEDEEDLDRELLAARNRDMLDR